MAVGRRLGQTGVMSATVIAWLVLVCGFVLPLAHVVLSPSGGSWTPPPGARCPFGPRVGWLVMVLFLGPLGWLLFVRSRRRRPQVLNRPAAPER
ncbi:MAG: hypothetical protein OEM93_06200 [Rhodospirillales bacterium]|nr:hypothetical protein [Rhodospirillales bacterium]MDH3791045.1 hypothetical protein [Rhodospirillales bacterium]MDH3970114.1 hypothetical protein [Rhodospirillales bacterium]